MSPDGEAIVTGAGDETLRFWNVFSKARSQKEAKSALNLFTSIRWTYFLERYRRNSYFSFFLLFTFHCKIGLTNWVVLKSHFLNLSIFQIFIFPYMKIYAIHRFWLFLRNNSMCITNFNHVYIFFTKNYAVCLWDLNPGLLCPLHPITHSLVDDQIDQNIKIC